MTVKPKKKPEFLGTVKEDVLAGACKTAPFSSKLQGAVEEQHCPNQYSGE